MKVIWLFGDSSVGKKTLINKLSMLSTTNKSNLKIRKLLNMDENSVLIPLTVDKENIKKKKEIISNFYLLRNIKDIVLMIHGQFFDIKHILPDFKKEVKNFKDFNFCFYLLPTEEDYKIRRTKRKKILSTNYISALKTKDNIIKRLKPFFNEIKIIEL